MPGSWLAELDEFLRIPSISADDAFAGDISAAGEWVCDFVRRAGGTCELVPTNRHPLAVGEIPASAPFRNGRGPTVLLYGHFDVQPPGADEDWESPPFEPETRDGWLYGRGAADDKGNLFLLLKAVELLAREDALPVTVRIACDGEEEVIGTSIVEFLEEDERGADACVIYDGAMPRRGLPFFFVGTRGLVYYHLRVETGTHDLHSGFYGGAALNATHVLLQTLSAVATTPEALRVGSAPPTEDEVAAWRELDPGAEVLAGQGATPADSTAAAEFYQRTLTAPAVDINGLKGGEAELQKTVLPVEAEANVSIRLAPGQDVETTAAVFEGPASLGGARRGAPRARTPVVQPRRARTHGRRRYPDRPRHVRANARAASSVGSLWWHIADRPGAGRQGHSGRPHGLRRPGRECSCSERTPAARVHPPGSRCGARHADRLPGASRGFLNAVG